MPIGPQDLVKGVSELISLPDVCIRVTEMTASPNYTAADIACVVSRDPGLSAQLLKIANSPYYGFPSRIDTISRAVTVIGNRELRDLVLATSVIATFSNVKHDLLDLSRYWRHSLHVGVIARHLAAKSRMRILHSERLFIAGLLHDVGRLVMEMKIGELVKVMMHRAQTDNIPLYLAEREVFDLDHGQVGAELMRCWGFPESLQEVVEFHHEPGNARNHPLEVSLVHIANNISEMSGYGVIGGERDVHFDPVAWELTGLSEERIAPIIETAEQQYFEAVATFLPLIAQR